MTNGNLRNTEQIGNLLRTIDIVIANVTVSGRVGLVTVGSSVDSFSLHQPGRTQDLFKGTMQRM